MPTPARAATAETGASGSARKTSRAASRMRPSLRAASARRPASGPMSSGMPTAYHWNRPFRSARVKRNEPFRSNEGVDMSFPVLTTALDVLRRTADAVPVGRFDDRTPCTSWTVAQVLLHAAGDQHGWAAFVAGGELPAYDPFNPPQRPDRDLAEGVPSAG